MAIAAIVASASMIFFTVKPPSVTTRGRSAVVERSSRRLPS
jgi:hypothetical protein